MSTTPGRESAREFVDRLASDEAMANRLEALEATSEALAGFIKSEGLNCSPEEVFAVLGERVANAGAAGSGGTLSDSQLEGVAGGGFPGMRYLVNRFKLQEAGLLFPGVNPGEEVVIVEKGN